MMSEAKRFTIVTSPNVFDYVLMKSDRKPITQPGIHTIVVLMAFNGPMSPYFVDKDLRKSNTPAGNDKNSLLINSLTQNAFKQPQ